MFSISASGLKAVDRGDTSDPYVVAKVGELEKQSSVVSKSLDPSWDETLEFESVSLDELIAGGLKLTVYDKNTFRFDVNLGEAEVSLEALRKPRSKPLTFTQTL